MASSPQMLGYCLLWFKLIPPWDFGYEFYLYNPNYWACASFGWCRVLSLWRELADLRKKKAELELQLHSLEEKEKNLRERARILEEKLAIQELERNLKAKHDVVEQLESRIRELERKLGQSQTETYVINPKPEEAELGTPKYLFRNGNDVRS